MSDQFPTARSNLDPTNENGGTKIFARLIPDRNPPALIGYYCGVFSLLPFMGLLCGLAAIPLGIIGLVRYHANHQVKGLVHALVALILGVIFTIVWSGTIFCIVYLNSNTIIDH